MEAVCSRFKSNIGNFSFGQLTAIFYSEGKIRTRIRWRSSTGNSASSRSRDAGSCWGMTARFSCTAGLIVMLAKPFPIPTPPQALFPWLSSLQLFLLGTSSYAGDCFHMEFKTQMKWNFEALQALTFNAVENKTNSK